MNQQSILYCFSLIVFKIIQKVLRSFIKTIFSFWAIFFFNWTNTFYFFIRALPFTVTSYNFSVYMHIHCLFFFRAPVFLQSTFKSRRQGQFYEFYMIFTTIKINSNNLINPIIPLSFLQIRLWKDQTGELNNEHGIQFSPMMIQFI